MAGMAVFVNRWGYGVHDITDPLLYKAGLSFREALRIAHGPNPWRRDEGRSVRVGNIEFMPGSFGGWVVRQPHQVTPGVRPPE